MRLLPASGHDGGCALPHRLAIGAHLRPQPRIGIAGKQAEQIDQAGPVSEQRLLDLAPHVVDPSAQSRRFRCIELDGQIEIGCLVRVPARPAAEHPQPQRSRLPRGVLGDALNDLPFERCQWQGDHDGSASMPILSCGQAVAR
ncbi:MAG: hypothetical protein MUC86_16015 [Burkholderiaceae bacterium]|nr:hypothetical protein [Burkholderiaceae bacterium]